MPIGPGQPGKTSSRLNQLRLDAGRLNVLVVAAPPSAPFDPVPAHAFVGGPYALAWSATGATTYDVRFGTTATPPTVSSGQTATSYTLPALTPGLTYYWQIIAINQYGSTPGPVWSFTAALPVAPSNPIPAHGAVDVTHAEPVLSWTGSPELWATYRVYFGLAGGSLALMATGLTMPEWPAPVLINATGYQWRIETVTNAGVSSGPIWNFTTWVLGQATNPSPASGATGVALSPTLTWTAGLHATSSRVYFGTFGESLSLVASGAITSWPVSPPLLPGQSYAWRIDSVNSGGTTTGAVWTFTAATLAAPVYVSPLDNAVEVSAATSIVWNAVTLATGYDVYFGTSPTPPLVSSNQMALSYDPPGFLGSVTRYYWRIVARHSTVTSSGPTWSFVTTDPTRPHIDIDGPRRHHHYRSAQRRPEHLRLHGGQQSAARRTDCAHRPRWPRASGAHLRGHGGRCRSAL
jgi:hypothetical protein